MSDVMCGGGVFDYKTPPSLHPSCASSNSGRSRWHIKNTEKKPPRKIAVKSSYGLVRSHNSSKFSRGTDTSLRAAHNHETKARSSPRTLNKLSDSGKTGACDEGMVADIKEDCCKVINLNMPLESSARPHNYALKHITRPKGNELCIQSSVYYFVLMQKEETPLIRGILATPKCDV